jgi:hypothetical protein
MSGNKLFANITAESPHPAHCRGCRLGGLLIAKATHFQKIAQATHAVCVTIVLG